MLPFLCPHVPLVSFNGAQKEWVCALYISHKVGSLKSHRCAAS